MKVWSLALFLVACSAPGSSEQRSGARGEVAGAPAAPARDEPKASTAPTAEANPSSPVLTTSSSAGAGGADAAAAEECGRQHFDVRRKPTDVLLVFDRSGSMDDEPDGAEDGSPSKWELVVPALKQSIMATDGAISWGLKFFPEGDDAGECNDESYPGSIAVPIAAMNAAKVNQAIDAAEPKGDGTPTGDAMNEAVKYLQQLNTDSSKYILLATDGDPSCAGKEKSGDAARTAALESVEAAASGGFDTFVVGIATTKKSSNKTLTELAAAGKRAPASGYYLANTQDELLTALRAITAAAVSCKFPLSSPPPVPEHVGVLIGMDRVAKDTAHKDGWDYVDADLSGIEVFGPACDKVIASGADSVNIVFGCKADELF